MTTLPESIAATAEEKRLSQRSRARKPVSAAASTKPMM
jgi:hypothetical protein